MRKKINIKKGGLCPFIQEECVKDECMVYHRDFEKCQIELIGYNMFKLSNALEQLPGKLKKLEERGFPGLPLGKH